MDQKIWSQVEELFEQTIALPANERSAFIATHKNLPPSVCAEVRSLVENFDAANEPNTARFFDAGIESLVKQLANEMSKEVGDSETVPSASQKNKSRFERESRIIEQLAKQAPDFEVLETVGHGGMGIVFRAREKSLDRIVALKVLHANLVDDALRRRFIRESQATAKIVNDHVVAIHGVHDGDGLPFLVMEFIDGPSLKEVIAKRTTIDPKLAAKLAHQVALGLDAAHEHQLIHRDVKPANIIIESFEQSFIRDSYRAKLVDFGIVRDLGGEGQTLDNLVVGTPAFMSPEQLFQPEEIDHRSDIYGLGMTLYEMLTGELPFRGAPHMIMRQVETSEPVEPRQFDDRIPRDLESICLKALNKSKDRRYTTAKEFAADLTRFLNGEPTIARPVPRRERIQRMILRNPKLSAALGAIATLFTALLVGSLVFAFTMKAKNNEIVKAQRATLDSRLETVLNARPSQLQTIIESSLPLPDSLSSRLRTEFSSTDCSIKQKFNASVALSHETNEYSAFIVDCIPELFESPDFFRNTVYGLENDPESMELLRARISKTDDEHEKAKLIVLLAQLGDLTPWKTAAARAKSPSLRTEVIHTFKNWHGDLSQLIKSAKKECDQEWVWTMSQALALMDHRSLGQEAFDASVDFLNACCEKNRFASVVSSSRLALQRWEVEFEKEPQPIDDSNWFVTNNGIRMVRIEPATVRLGRLDPLKQAWGWPPHEVTITKPYFIADAETTIGQFSKFAKVYQKQSPKFNWNPDPDICPTPEHPAHLVSWNGAVRFCNWLSETHGLEPVYEKLEENLAGELADGTKFEIMNFKIHRDANGFRLPNEGEWEHACRAGTESSYYYGNRGDLFPFYGIGSNFKTIEAASVRSHLPNPNGLFDMIGNVWEWTNDWSSNDVASDPVIDPIGPPTYSQQGVARVTRGGGIDNRSGEIDVDARGADHPSIRYGNLGFRVVLPGDTKITSQ